MHGDNWCFALTRKAHFQKPNVSKVSIFGLKLITYIHTSPVSRRDSLGNTGRIVAGDVQVMSAGSGIRRAGFNLEPQTTKGELMPYHPPPAGRLPFVSWQYRAMTSAIGEELRARYLPPDQLSTDLRRLLRQIPCSHTRRSSSRPRRSHEMWLTDDEPRRIAEISLHFLSRC